MNRTRRRRAHGDHHPRGISAATASRRFGRFIRTRAQYYVVHITLLLLLFLLLSVRLLYGDAFYRPRKCNNVLWITRPMHNDVRKIYHRDDARDLATSARVLRVYYAVHVRAVKDLSAEVKCARKLVGESGPRTAHLYACSSVPSQHGVYLPSSDTERPLCGNQSRAV